MTYIHVITGKSLTSVRNHTVGVGYKNIVGNCIQCSYNRHVGYNGYRL